jgi:GNAT superfamily N-acetyltransferase
LTRFETTISIYNYNLKKDWEEEDWEEDIGYIEAYRFNNSFYDEESFPPLGISHDDKDVESFSLAFFGSGGLFLEAREVGYANYVFYISRVFINPERRNQQYGLTALVAFLTLFAQGQTVACHPLPMNDLREKYLLEYGKAVMCRYWQRAGFNRYEEENNILWVADWYPEQGMIDKLAEVFD